MVTGETSSTSDQVIRISIRDFLGLCIFLLTLGIGIGGFIKVIGEINDLSSKVEEVYRNIHQLEISNTEIKANLSNILRDKDDKKLVNSN